MLQDVEDLGQCPVGTARKPMSQTRPWHFISVVLRGTGALAAGIHTGSYYHAANDEDDEDDDDDDLFAL